MIRTVQHTGHLPARRRAHIQDQPEAKSSIGSIGWFFEAHSGGRDALVTRIKPVKGGGRLGGERFRQGVLAAVGSGAGPSRFREAVPEAAAAQGGRLVAEGLKRHG